MSAGAYTAGYRPFPVVDFSAGLNLRDKSDTVGDAEAIDLLNVTFNERGAIYQRDGYTDLTAADLTNRVDSLSPFYTAGGVRQLIAGAGTRLEALNASGNIVASQAGLFGGPWQFARFGDPTHEYLYAGNGRDTLQRWDGTAWVSGAALAKVDGVTGRAMPKAGAVCVTASTPGSTSGTNASNRMIATAFGTQVNAGPNGAVTTPSRVYESNAGQPELWETDGDPGDPATQRPARGRNYYDLTPGDGEQIMGAASWRELTFIFKETKFFVRWGEGGLSDGTPTFQVREVVNSVGLSSPLALAVGRDGVYFFNRRGVYRTSGGDPVLLSDKLSPLWTGDPEVYYRGDALNLAQFGLVRMFWHMEQLFVAVPTGTRTYNDRLLVYDTQHGWWTVYDIAASALTSFRRADRGELHHGYSTGPQRVGRRNYGSTADRGAPITSRWRSGWSDQGSSQVKTMRETKVWGAGAALVSFAVDFNRDPLVGRHAHFTALGSAWTYAQLSARSGMYADLGGVYLTYTDLAANQSQHPTVADVLVRYATRGTVFSVQFANDPDAPAWSVHRYARHLREIREASIL